MNRYFDKVNASNALPVDFKPTDSLCTLYFKFPYLVLSNFAHLKIRTMVKRYCKHLNIKLLVSSFKIKKPMNINDSVPRLFRLNVVCKFICVEFNSA